MEWGGTIGRSTVSLLWSGGGALSVGLLCHCCGVGGTVGRSTVSLLWSLGGTIGRSTMSLLWSGGGTIGRSTVSLLWSGGALSVGLLCHCCGVGGHYR